MEAIRLRLTLLHKDPDGPNTPRVTGRPQPMEDLRLPAQLHLGTITGRDTRLMVQGLGSRRLRLLLQRPGRRRPLLRLALVHLLRHRVDLRQDLALIRVLMGSRHITISIRYIVNRFLSVLVVNFLCVKSISPRHTGLKYF